MKRALLLLAFLCFLALGFAMPRFYVGAALIEVGYLFQHISYGAPLSAQEGAHTPDEVMTSLDERNSWSAGFRKLWRVMDEIGHRDAPPLAGVIVACMDYRLDTDQILGNSRGEFYVIRKPGAALTNETIEEIFVALHRNPSIILVTTHSDCAMEKLAHTQEGPEKFPNLTAGVLNFKQRLAELQAMPEIQKRVAAGSLKIIMRHIDTQTERLVAAQF